MSGATVGKLFLVIVICLGGLIGAGKVIEHYFVGDQKVFQEATNTRLTEGETANKRQDKTIDKHTDEIDGLARENRQRILEIAALNTRADKNDAHDEAQDQALAAHSTRMDQKDADDQRKDEENKALRGQVDKLSADLAAARADFNRRDADRDEAQKQMLDRIRRIESIVGLREPQQ